MRLFNIDASRPAPRALWLTAALAVAALAGACTGPLTQTAQYTNAAQTMTVHALTGTPNYFATAFSIPANSTTKVDGSFSFDVAFDIDATGKILYLPPHMVGENPLGNRQIGIQKATTSFDNVSQAPLNGYVYDSVTVAKVGETVIVQSPSSTCSLYALPYLYAKFVIDSTDPVTRTMWGRVMVDQNCTFRSLTAGVPTN
jgi:hypothetical protein